MTTPVKDLKGATDAIVTKLSAMGIKDNEQLVQAAASPAQRKELAGACGCDTAELLQLANRADLARIKGVSGVYSDLLEIAGVDTVKELAARRADNLHATLIATNDKDGLTEKPPAQSTVEDWIAQAKAAPKVLTY